ncbi:DUF2798 domain-containing protein [Methylobacillus arboreus]|uniref:DUF2798 domain-containing protein n=1 Tax=Methylobacillus arboreus TaxID=755170 RepID=UPI001E44DD51|nr:DUF2798 domain-containing protein [Methylobacillus arboreus]MCB5191176.1 DUF2798 domain-containing protein [Methylobacillus arboreus]
MRINRKYKLPTFAVFMSASTSLIVSATILWLRGVPGEVFLAQWLQAFTSAWPVVFAVILLLAPPIDRMLERVVDWN